MRKSTRRITTTVAAVLVAATIGCAASGEISSTVSPGGKYTVTISQDGMFAERYVYLNVSRARAPLVRQLLYTNDFLDDKFTERYPASSWRSESVLWIGGAYGGTDDTVRVSNTSTRRLAYRLIETYHDKFVLLDVEPHATVILRFNYFGRLSAQGQVLNSGVRFADAVEFPGGENQIVDGAQFSILVREDAVTIAGPADLKHVRCCAVDRPAFGFD